MCKFGFVYARILCTVGRDEVTLIFYLMLSSVDFTIILLSPVCTAGGESLKIGRCFCSVGPRTTAESGDQSSQ